MKEEESKRKRALKIRSRYNAAVVREDERRWGKMREEQDTCLLQEMPVRIFLPKEVNNKNKDSDVLSQTNKLSLTRKQMKQRKVAYRTFADWSFSMEIFLGQEINNERTKQGREDWKNEEAPEAGREERGKRYTLQRWRKYVFSLNWRHNQKRFEPEKESLEEE